MKLQVIREWSLGSPMVLCFAAPLRLGSGAIDGFIVAHSNSAGSNPWIEMFSFPTDTLKLTAFDLAGRKMWTRDLGPAVVPNLSFCPVFPFDLDGDGVDEIYFVNNLDPVHPLAISQYRLERLDAATGRTTGQLPWPGRNSEGAMHNAFRNVIAGGCVRGQPVLLTAQGLYQDMYLQAWNPGLSMRWETAIPDDNHGARGSHMHPVVDINEDGVDEWMWGERCIETDAGRELFCADGDTYGGHSDIIQPFRNPCGNNWLLFTAREKQNFVAPRVAVYDATGARVWGDLDHGHMHTGWVARLEPGRLTALALRIGAQRQSPKARFIENHEVFAYDAPTGRPVQLPFSPFRTIPVDLNGDGLHELARGRNYNEQYGGDVLDGRGNILGAIDGAVAIASKFMPLPGEQLLTYRNDGTFRIWADAEAVDTEAALNRYRSPAYTLHQRFSACGSHLQVLGGF